jgi:hypothetical protein
MRLTTTEPRSNRLPKSFPVGAVYVVEGKGGDYGQLSVSARYVIMPGGQRIDVAAKPPEVAAAPVRRRLRLVSSGRPAAARPKRFSRRTKKFVVATGTAARARR